jgi:hypothetical protein
MVTADSTGVEDFTPILYKDTPLVSVLPIPGELLKSWKDSKVNTNALVSMYADMTGSTVIHLDSKKFVLEKDGKREVRNFTDSIKEQIVERVRDKMQQDLNSLVSGDMLNIQNVTNGHPVLYKEIKDGKLETVNRPFIQVFPEYKMKNGQPENFKLEIIENDNPTFGNTSFEIGKGTVVVVKDDMPQTLYTRKLNNSEVDSVLALLSLSKDKSFPLDTYEKDGKQESRYLLIGGSKVTTLNVFPHFSTNPTDSDKVSILSMLINYGVKNRKSDTLNNWDIFKSLKGKIVFKYKDIVYSIDEKDVLNPDKNKDLRDFLTEKKVNINKFLVEKKGSYFHPKATFENGIVKITYSFHKSYADYIMNDAAVSYNYRTPEGQTLFQKNVVLETDETGSLVKNKAATQKQPKPAAKQSSVVPDVYKFTAPADVMESIKFSAKYNNTLFKNYGNGLYKIAEEELDKNGMTTKRTDSYFLVENGIFYPAPAGYASLDKASLDVMNTSPDNSLKQFSSEATKYSIEDVGIKQDVKPAPVTSDIKVGDKVKVNTPKNGEGIVKEIKGDKVLLEDGRPPISIKNLTKLESTTQPQAAPVSTDAKADIERRRQEELESNASGIRVKVETYNTLNISGEPVQVEITTNKDGSRILKARAINEDGSIDPMAFVTERINNKSQLSLTNEKLIEGYIGNEGNTLKKLSENLNPPDARTNKINAKYDAELAALKQQPIVLGTISDEGFIEPTVEIFEDTKEPEVTQPTTVSQEELDRAKAIALGEAEETPADIQAVQGDDVSIFEENKSKAIQNLKSMSFPNPKALKVITIKYKAAKTQQDLDDLAKELKKICES